MAIAADCVVSWDQEHRDVTLRYLGRGIATIGDLDEVFPKPGR